MVPALLSGWRLPRAWCLLLLVLQTAVQGGEPPRVAIIIDDLGNALTEGLAAVRLPGPVTCAFLPHTPFAPALAEKAYLVGKEIMLHLPMQSGSGGRLGPGALTLDMTEQEFRQTLQSSLGSIPHVSGVNNHMGSLLTRHPGAMQWLMQGLKHRGLFFIDSRTSVFTVAQQVAVENGLANARRDVFLDNVREAKAIRGQLRLLVRKARQLGQAIAIGHPSPVTLEVLREELPALQAQGIRLVPASELTEKPWRRKIWHASSSPLPKVARSSKQ